MTSQEPQHLEKASSAVTLSDMEVFIFPDLMYSLVLANMMSPRIWQWRDDPWFDGLGHMKPYRRITRLKQYIMDHYMFNLDLDTWGLTTKEREVARFSDFVDEKTLAGSNALFGYEGDKYYFNIDIRTHFGLDKYEGNIIPYWKTETVEAMDAFRHKPNYNMGAGECVSLATLYAAALFIVARIPLRDIFLMATPLHSQNFVDIDEGILTNNRRLVTKNMWSNGSALSAQARRALENERVTVVAHETGHIHTLYEEATISPDEYGRFSAALRSYLSSPLSPELLGNFLRHDHAIQKCFQLRRGLHGSDHYVPMERVLAYEHGGPYRITDKTRAKLMSEIDMEEFQDAPFRSRIILNDLEAFVRENPIDLSKPDDVRRLQSQFASDCLNAEIAIECLGRFCHVEPRLPDPESKQFVGDGRSLGIEPEMTREDVIARVHDIRSDNETAEMALYAYRDLGSVGLEAFLKAAIERNPVSVEAAADQPTDSIVSRIREMPNTSIYDGPCRLAQPDEVWNYARGDGAEKAVLLAGILHARRPDVNITISVEDSQVVVKVGSEETAFPTDKRLPAQEWHVP